MKRLHDVKNICSYVGALSMLRLVDDSTFNQGILTANALVEQLISKLDITRLCK